MSNFQTFFSRLTLFVLTRSKSRAKLLIAQRASVEKGMFGSGTGGINKWVYVEMLFQINECPDYVGAYLCGIRVGLY